ncbi:MAG: hypothetical protein J5601_00335 [Elusimicrobiaceae bacterium]|nr:hypothetical protein [Elusimicrobiaceae bacterium]
MKLKLKIMCAVLMLAGVCAPAFSTETDYAPIFRKTMKVEPSKASMEQMRSFYNQSPWSNEAKAEIMVQMADWKGIHEYDKYESSVRGLLLKLPSVKFLDFALTIENRLYAEEDSILVPIYEDGYFFRGGGILDDWTNDIVAPTDVNSPAVKKWQKEIDKVLGDKTVRVGKENMRASWVARGALFQAALQQSITRIDHNETTVSFFGDTWYGYSVMNQLGVFAVNNTIFGAKSVKRQKLMSDVLRFLTEYVALYYEGNIEHPDSRFFKNPDARMRELYATEALLKRNGGKGIDPKDPNLKKIKEAQSKIAKKNLRKRVGK